MVSNLNKLIAFAKMFWYYHQSERMIDKAFKVLSLGDTVKADKLYFRHRDYEKKAKMCDWGKQEKVHK